MQTATRAQRKSIVGTVSEILQTEGIAGLWRGIGPSLILSFNPAITFLVFEKLKGQLGLGRDVRAGVGAGLLRPWLARVVVAAGCSGVVGACGRAHAGLTSHAVPLPSSSAFMEARARANDPKARLTTFQFFVMGAIAKTCATIITYPYIMAKVPRKRGCERGGGNDKMGEKTRWEKRHDGRKDTMGEKTRLGSARFRSTLSASGALPHLSSFRGRSTVRARCPCRPLFLPFVALIPRSFHSCMLTDKDAVEDDGGHGCRQVQELARCPAQGLPRIGHLGSVPGTSLSLLPP